MARGLKIIPILNKVYLLHTLKAPFVLIAA
jgi:translation elongation factor EF-4